MINSILTDELPTVTRILRDNGVKKAYAFGSVCTDQFNDDNDIDLLIAFDESLNPVQYGKNYFTVAHALESILKRPVDLVTEQSLQNPYLLPRSTRQKRPFMSEEVRKWLTDMVGAIQNIDVHLDGKRNFVVYQTNITIRRAVEREL